MKNTKYPFMVEFTGSPEAGKTTCIKSILARFDENLKVGYIVESAEIVDKNIPKGSFYSHLSMRLTTINKIIEAKYSDCDIVLIDRGIIDGIFFTIKFLTENPSDYSNCAQLISLLNSLKDILPNFLLIFKTSPEIAIQRKGHEGSIVTLKFVEEYNRLLDSFEKEIKVPHFVVDTSYMLKKEKEEKVYNLIINEYGKRVS